MGKLIVIDGLDGSGKATQADILYRRLKEIGKNAYKVSFPDYDSKSSEAVKMYLKGELGKEASKINPYMCSIFYAVDRAIQFQQTLYDLYNQRDSIIICDRYISANIIHQGSKLNSLEEQHKYFDWVYDTEVNKIGLPKEDITIILSLPVEVSQSLMNKRYDNNEKLKDIHESNTVYLEKCYGTVRKAAEYFENSEYNWKLVECSSDNNNIKSKEEIAKLIWKHIENIL